MKNKNERAVKTSITVYPTTLDQLLERGKTSPVIERDINRLYLMYRRSLLQLDLTFEEVKFVCNTINKENNLRLINTIDTGTTLWLRIKEYAAVNQLTEEAGIDIDKLIKKLQKLSIIEAMALIDSAERFLKCCSDDPKLMESQTEKDNLLKELFLVK